ncbi:hypothetical protein PI95_031785 [Hassallia byssoidea VB512170]|uniref:Uncharacterized protein n=1 Tax=Hassallia byssoidea VB512170 TaxID=1304833 RepID=A0A846HHX9_9CYAN|nr:hypothetical protein [Hassalia byssoidea]NEU76956.1 hypothetical protein [Hassalia byssoidea VB512170]
MVISTFNKAKTIVKSLDSATGQSIIPVFSNTLVGNYPGQIVSVNAFVKNLKAHAKISSLAPVKLPNFQLEDSETDKLYKTLDIEWGSARKQLNLYISDNQTDWYQVGAISLLNPSGYPYRIYNLMDLITDNLAIELGENGRIGVQIQDVGYGALQTGDLVTIHGSYVQEIATDSNATIQSTIDFEKLVEVESTVILGANPLRKYLAITNNGNNSIYLNLGDSATLGKGLYLTPAGSFDLDKPYFGSISAISTSDISSVSGVECS